MAIEADPDLQERVEEYQQQRLAAAYMAGRIVSRVVIKEAVGGVEKQTPKTNIKDSAVVRAQIAVRKAEREPKRFKGHGHLRAERLSKDPSPAEARHAEIAATVRSDAREAAWLLETMGVPADEFGIFGKDGFISKHAKSAKVSGWAIKVPAEPGEHTDNVKKNMNGWILGTDGNIYPIRREVKPETAEAPLGPELRHYYEPRKRGLPTRIVKYPITRLERVVPEPKLTQVSHFHNSNQLVNSLIPTPHRNTPRKTADEVVSNWRDNLSKFVEAKLDAQLSVTGRDIDPNTTSGPGVIPSHRVEVLPPGAFPPPAAEEHSHGPIPLPPVPPVEPNQ